MFEDFFFPLTVGVIFIGVILTGMLMWSAIIGCSEHSRLMEQCMKDGHKEYECVGILKKNVVSSHVH